MRSRALSVDQEMALTAAYIANRPLKVLAYEFGISDSYVTTIAVRNGAHRRHRKVMWAAPTGHEGAVLALFRQGLDSLSIAVRLGIKECVVANALARARETERRQ